ncbi:MAG TPA: transglycosylase SLT domain-containing protein [Candidatus Sulfotelmatobacter sp.]|jgi:hypothetical protein|nr:transglycosylase SLT domain-containing protein [Candidatus Sulfotelmatobacter sp.]
MPRLLLPALLLCNLVLGAPCARAGLLAASDDCTSQFPAAESRWDIPKGLLSAISQVESNRWPWTIDAAGESHSFASRTEAEQAAQLFRAQGLRNIDLGCMQISMLHHGDAFATLSQAFDPAANVEFAARFLAGLKRLAGSWEAAVSRYHSATPSLGGPYLQRVLAAWRGNGGAAPSWSPTATFTVETKFGVHIWRPVTHPVSDAATNAPSPQPRYLIIINPKPVHPR